jgi:hypothetical protein
VVEILLFKKYIFFPESQMLHAHFTFGWAVSPQGTPTVGKGQAPGAVLALHLARHDAGLPVLLLLLL